MGKVVSGAAWEGPSGWGRWGGLSGTVSFPADGTCRLSQGHQACAVFWSHRPNLQRQSHSGRSGLAFGGPPQLRPRPLPSTICPRRAPSLWPGAPPDRMPEVEADVSAGPSPARLPASPASSQEGGSVGRFCFNTSQKEQCPSPGGPRSGTSPLLGTLEG